VTINDIVLGPPTLADIDNNGNLEIILGSGSSFAPDTGKIYVFKYDGTQMNNFPIDLGEMAGGIPSVGDINNDSYLEIIDNDMPFSDPYKIFVLSHTGDNFPGWPIQTKGSYSRPSLSDIDGDGYLDAIIAGGGIETEYYHLCAYDYNGDNLSGNWPAWVSCPEGMQAIGDIDNDGDLEIVVGTSYWYPSDTKGIYAFDHMGNIIDGWPVEVGKRFPTPITLADLDQDGDLEIMGSADYGYFNLYVYHHNGTKALEIIDGNGLYNEIVPTDLDGDNDLELLTVKNGQVNAFHHDGQLVNEWPVSFDGIPGGGGGSANGEPSVVVGDIDGDCESEILISSNIGTKNLIHAWNCDGTSVENFPIEIIGGPFDSYANGALALGDLDDDGDIEIVFVGYQQSISQGIYRTDIYVIDIDSQYNAVTMQWPQFHHDAQHTGLYKRIFDTDPPVVEIIKPENALYIRNKEKLPLCKPLIIGYIDIEVEASDEESGINRVEFYIDGELKYNDTTEPYIWTWDERTPFRFRHTIKVIAYDEAGNYASSEISVRKFF